MDELNKTSGSNGKPTKEQMMKRNSLMADELDDFDPSELDLEGDDWRDVFDYDAPADTIQPSESLSMPPPADKKKDRFSLSSTSSSGQQISESETRRQGRTAFQIERADNSTRPPSWHSEAADMPYRHAMKSEIAQLLFARKKNSRPDEKWMGRLPVKARMLEAQLYKRATSLEAYLDRSTLKSRLGKLASAITSHYKQSMHGRRNSTRSSASRSSASRSSASSIMSASSLGSLEDAFSNAKLRRSSTESIPTTLKSISPSDGKLRSDQSDSTKSSLTTPDPNTIKLRLEESDKVTTKTTTANTGTSSSIPISTGKKDSIATQINSFVVPSGNTHAMVQQQANSMQIQQQLFRQLTQQQNLLGQMGKQTNNPMVVRQAGLMSNNVMAMMNQLQQQQGMNNLNLMQQQNRQGIVMPNIALLQQQQQQQQQQRNAMLMGAMPNNGMRNMSNTGMNMANFSLPNVIPGTGGRNFQNFINGNNPMMAGESNSMPPPSALTNTPHRATGGNDKSSPLSPNSFRW